jgi:ABC-type transport system substrate-binding protein
MGCDGVTPNDPYPADEASASILYGSFSERPKYLDPARSYSADESVFTQQIYEPPLQYAYIPGVYQLIPQTATALPEISFRDAQGRVIDGDKFPEKVAETLYRIRIQPQIQFQPHPAFARDEAGNFHYHHLDPKALARINTLDDFTEKGTRELRAADYVYEIKRLAWPKLNSPIYELMSGYIVGFKEFHDELRSIPVSPELLRDKPLSGVTLIDPYTYEIRIKGLYRQFPYWLAMPFFSPIPWEADVFYNQKAMIDKNIVLDWYPVGTGPYLIEKNNPNSQMVLAKNPNYRDEFYQGQKIPQIDKVVYSLEKESIPRWNKFLQGFYDSSGVDSDNFATAIQIMAGQSEITPALKAKNISLVKEIEIADYYWGFNMRDPLVGGYSEKQQKLRQAISIAIDVEEYIQIFLNGRGMPAQFMLPPGIFGYSEESNPYVYNTVNGKLVRKSIDEAKKLLAEAGYPEGHDPRTGEPLIIHFDVPTGGGPQDQARDGWMRKQFKKLGVDLDVRSTDYNRFREKLANGTFQFYFFGWVGDYPDPENFLFLLYGPNGKRDNAGVNDANYDNPEFNQLFEKMVVMKEGPERLALIQRMKTIAQKDAPFVWGLFPEAYLLRHGWLTQVITNDMVRNGLKYYRIDAQSRDKARVAWNQPRLWPLVLGAMVLALIFIPVWVGYRRKEHRQQVKRFNS